jgi:hypothetical protein
MDAMIRDVEVAVQALNRHDGVDRDLDCFLEELRETIHYDKPRKPRAPSAEERHHDWVRPVVTGGLILLGLLGLAVILLLVLGLPVWVWYVSGGSLGAALLIWAICADRARELEQAG